MLRVTPKFGRCLIFPRDDSRSDNYVLYLIQDEKDVNWDEFEINEWNWKFVSVKLYWRVDLGHPEL